MTAHFESPINFIQQIKMYTAEVLIGPLPSFSTFEKATEVSHNGISLFWRFLKTLACFNTARKMTKVERTLQYQTNLAMKYAMKEVNAYFFSRQEHKLPLIQKRKHVIHASNKRAQKRVKVYKIITLRKPSQSC